MAGMDRNHKPRRFSLEDRFIEFAAVVMNIVDSLPDSRPGNHVLTQLLRSGSSPAPNYAEALSAESRRDFIHKLGIALKELRETHVWLRIVKRMQFLPENLMLDHAIAECNELTAILVASINTAKKNLGKRQESV